MFHKTSNPKSDSDRLCPSTEPPNVAAPASQQIDRNKTSSSSTNWNAQQAAATALHQHYLNYFNNKIPKEIKSHRTRGSIFNSLSQPPPPHQAVPKQEMQINRAAFLNQRNSQNIRTQDNIQQVPSFHHHKNLTNNLSKSVSRDEGQILSTHRQHQQNPTKQRTFSSSAISSHPHQGTLEPSRNGITYGSRQEYQLDRDNEEVATIIKELENDSEDLKDSELDSLERNLPIELSFLIRQQAYCMAKMNYLDRQIRELKEAAHQIDSTTPQVSSTSIMNQSHPNIIMSANPAAMTHTKNGNFILSDDSGGEYSRATISDDDELSSLLDQIAKSIRPERSNFNAINNQQSIATTNHSAIISNQPQQYAIVNSNQLHHQQAVPIFVMGSPIAVAHPASSINSNVLPGVHFQPEPRYNQYYEGFYYQNNGYVTNPASSLMHKQQNGGGIKSQQFDNSISAIEQLVSQKEKRQIKSQLKSADNWLKMRSSGMCNSQNEGSINGQCISKTSTVNGTRLSDVSVDKNGSTTGRANIPSSSSSTIATGDNRVIEEDTDQ